MNSSQRIVFFVEWDATFVEFIRGISLSPALRGNIVVHTFYRHDIPAKVLPKYKPWLFKHPASSENIDAAWRLLEAYVTRYKFDADYSLTADLDKKRPKTSESFYSRGGSAKSTSERSRSGIISVPSRCFSYYVMSKSKENCKQLSDAIFKKFRVRLEIVDFQVAPTLLDFVQYKCPLCRIIFAGKRELICHDKEVHGLICPNVECIYHHKENSFRQERDLQQHIKNQLRCAFCPTKVFCSPEMLEVHRRNSHKKCACPCGRYYGERLTYLDHFFASYPTPTALSASRKLPKLTSLNLK